MPFSTSFHLLKFTILWVKQLYKKIKITILFP